VLSRSFAAVIVGVVVTSLGFTKPTETGDRKSIQGDWQFVALNLNGDDGSKESLEKMRLKITFSEWILVVEGQEVPISYQLDDSKKPKQLSLIFDESIKPAIYELNGDTLKICWYEKRNRKKDKEGKDIDPGRAARRPTEFKTGPGIMVMILKRAK
jgi:uncharacterized protein (TIGR03067 family)